MSTKEKILEAALTLFAENGYDGTSVEQIANAIGIKAPSLYKRMLLVQEQFRNERISEATTKHQLDGIQRMFAKIIKGMMDEGIVVKDDPELLAVELTAPAVLQIARADSRSVRKNV